MENLYPFLLRLARKVQFKRRKTENVCRPHCTLEHLIFQHSSSCAESVTCIYNGVENCPFSHFDFDSIKVLDLSWMLGASHHLLMCVFTLATQYARVAPVRSMFSITIHHLLTKYDTFGETNIYSNLKHDISQCTIHILRQIILHILRRG